MLECAHASGRVFHSVVVRDDVIRCRRDHLHRRYLRQPDRTAGFTADQFRETVRTSPRVNLRRCQRTCRRRALD